MVGVQDFQECPQCHSNEYAKNRGLVTEFETRDGLTVAGCTVCGYGFQEMLVLVCTRCGLDFNMLVSNLEDADWMLDDGFGVKACPNCSCTHTHREYARYDVGIKWISIPMKDLHPISELVDELTKPK